MEWNKKVEMVKLSNSANSIESRKKFYSYVMENLDEFDEQAFDILINAIELIPTQLKEDIEFCKVLYSKFQEHQFNELSIRNALRIEMFKLICENDLGL